VRVFMSEVPDMDHSWETYRPSQALATPFLTQVARRCPGKGREALDF
jgi:hypothetical protein